MANKTFFIILIVTLYTIIYNNIKQFIDTKSYPSEVLNRYSLEKSKQALNKTFFFRNTATSFHGQIQLIIYDGKK